jgi:hypothetical protein
LLWHLKTGAYHRQELSSGIAHLDEKQTSRRTEILLFIAMKVGIALRCSGNSHPEKMRRCENFLGNKVKNLTPFKDLCLPQARPFTYRLLTLSI